MDSYRHKGLRKKLVKKLREKGITDDRILNAIGTIPRHRFIDPAFDDWAYKDVAFPIGSGQTISQPYTVAYQTQLLEIRGKEKVLEIGTGSGYQACVLAELGVKVYTIERQEKLFKKTYDLLIELGYQRIRTLLGDGYKGAPKFAPFDRILVTAGATEIPQALLDQLKPGGILVIPVGEGETQKMLKVTKDKNGNITEEEFGRFSFVPFLPGVARK